MKKAETPKPEGNLNVDLLQSIEGEMNSQIQKYQLEQVKSSTPSSDMGPSRLHGDTVAARASVTDEGKIQTPF